MRATTKPRPMRLCITRPDALLATSLVAATLTLAGAVSCSSSGSSPTDGRKDGVAGKNDGGVVPDGGPAVDAADAANGGGDAKADSFASADGDSGAANPPSPPTGLGATAESCSRVKLAWMLASAAGLRGVRIYRDGELIREVAADVPTTLDGWAAPSNRYSYEAAAIDGAGNESMHSAPAAVTTPACPAAPADFLDVGVFGAVGDCAADDTAALQSALDAAKGSRGLYDMKTISLGARRCYRISSTLHVSETLGGKLFGNDAVI